MIEKAFRTQRLTVSSAVYEALGLRVPTPDGSLAG
jgi:hypothetical protein